MALCVLQASRTSDGDESAALGHAHPCAANRRLYRRLGATAARRKLDRRVCSAGCDGINGAPCKPRGPPSYPAKKKVAHLPITRRRCVALPSLPPTHIVRCHRSCRCRQSARLLQHCLWRCRCDTGNPASFSFWDRIRGASGAATVASATSANYLPSLSAPAMSGVGARRRAAGKDDAAACEALPRPATAADPALLVPAPSG